MINGFERSARPDRASKLRYRDRHRSPAERVTAVVLSPSLSGERGMKKMRGMVALYVALTVAAGSSALLAQNVDKKQEEKRSKAEQLDIAVLLKGVDTVAAGQAAPTDTMVTWESNHFIRSQDGTTYVPF